MQVVTVCDSGSAFVGVCCALFALNDTGVPSLHQKPECLKNGFFRRSVLHFHTGGVLFNLSEISPRARLSSNRGLFQSLSRNEVRGFAGEKRLRCKCFSFDLSSLFRF